MTGPTTQDADESRPLRIVYPLVGGQQHGLHRYARLLARAVGELGAEDPGGVEVETVETQLGRGLGQDRATIAEAAEALRGVDVCHLQFNGPTWGRRPLIVLRNLSLMLRSAPCPVVVTVHDVAHLPATRSRLLPPSDPDATLAESPYTDDEVRRSRRGWKTLLTQALRAPNRWAHRRVLSELRRHTAGVIVFNNIEADALAEASGGARPYVLPHFVERRPAADPAAASERYGIPPDAPVLTVLGFVHERKGHDIALEALAYLPPETVVVFAGSAPEKAARYATHLSDRIATLGVGHRVISTGFLEDADLDAVLARTDVAVCPFRSVSASGSLSTWLSAGTPIVVSDLPQMADYARKAPSGVRLFRRGDPVDLARAVGVTLAADRDEARTAVARLADDFAIERIAAQHVDVYREATRHG